jgi:hypothetical protein
MRFSIRDLLWLTLVVAMGLGWWVSYRALDDRRLEAVRQAHSQRYTLTEAKRIYGELCNVTTTWTSNDNPQARLMLLLPMDWSALDQPLVEE